VRGRAGRHRPDRHLQGDGQSPPVRAAPKGKYILGGLLDSSIANFAPLRVPTKGDTLRLGADVPCREFLYYKHLVKQENPRTPIASVSALHQRRVRQNQKVLVNGYWEIPFGDIDFNKIDNWLEIDKVLRQVPGQFPDKTVEIRKLLYLNTKSRDAIHCEERQLFHDG